MTIIIALKDIENDRILMGCDNQGTMGDMCADWGKSKIFQVQIPITKTEDDDDCTKIDSYKPLYIGFTGVKHVQDYLEYVFHPPCMKENESFIEYLYNQFFQSLSNNLSEHKILKEECNVSDSNSGLILVFDGEIYNVYDDFSIVHETRDFSCRGSGYKIAYGVLTNLLNHHDYISYEKMIEEALLTTGELNLYCNTDFVIKEIKLCSD